MRYNNNGNWNRNLIRDTLKDFCEISDQKFSWDLLYSKDFIHYVLFLCEELSTNKEGAGEFIRINKEILEHGDYTSKTADYLFKTFSYIVRELNHNNKKKWRIA